MNLPATGKAKIKRTSRTASVKIKNRSFAVVTAKARHTIKTFIKKEQLVSESIYIKDLTSTYARQYCNLLVLLLTLEVITLPKTSHNQIKRVHPNHKLKIKTTMKQSQGHIKIKIDPNQGNCRL